MLFTITCTAPDATDLGYLLHKNPSSLFERRTSFGTARVFYPEASPERCTAALLVEIDPVGLVRGSRGVTLAQYVSDRPYVPSSFLSVALGEVFGTALAGRSKDRPGRVGEKLPLSATLHTLDCDGGEGLIRRVWEPLGYAVTVRRLALDPRFPAWGESGLYAVTLEGQQTVRDLLTHVYVLVPVLDNAKRYAIGEDEVEKLLRRGEGWLSAHPEKDLIARRYLRYKRRLADAALARLADIEGVPDAEEGEDAAPRDAAEQRLETPVRLNDRRIAAAVEVVRGLDPPARRVLDLGCGEGRTMEALLKNVPGLEHVAGMDASSFALERAARRLRLERMDERERSRVSLFQGSLVYRDARLEGASDRWSASSGSTPARAAWSSPPPTPSTTRSGPRCRRAASAIPTTGSSGRAPSSPRGRARSPRATATPPPSPVSATKTRKVAARRRRWRCST